MSDLDIKKYLDMKNSGKTAKEVFAAAKKDGLKNFLCLMVLQSVFEITLDEARKSSYEYHGLTKEGKKKS